MPLEIPKVQIRPIETTEKNNTGGIHDSGSPFTDTAVEELNTRFPDWAIYIQAAGKLPKKTGRSDEGR